MRHGQRCGLALVDNLGLPVENHCHLLHAGPTFTDTDGSILANRGDIQQHIFRRLKTAPFRYFSETFLRKLSTIMSAISLLKYSNYEANPCVIIPHLSPVPTPL